MIAEYKIIFQRLDFIRFLATKEYRASALGTLLGKLWLLLLPLAQVGVYYFLVVVLFQRHEMYGNDPLAFLLIGVFHYAFVSEALQSAATSILSKERLLMQVKIEPVVLVATSFLTSLLNSAIPLALAAAIYALRGAPTWRLALYPAALLTLGLLIWALALIVACLTVFSRDLRHILAIVLRVLIYLCPVVYPMQYIPAPYLAGYLLNPVACVFALIDFTLFNTAPPPLASLCLLYAQVGGLLFLSHAVYRWRRPRLTKDF